MTRLLITGGAGFIGSHLVDRLIIEGNQITVYDNLSSGKKTWIEHHIRKENFLFVEADLLDSKTLTKSMEGQEVVWHLGANTDIPSGIKMPDLDLKNCTIATWNVLEAMRHTDINRILFSSTSAVYGDVPPITLTETTGPLLPISLYGAGKLACEGLISAYCHLFNLQAWMFRFGNVLGSRMGHGVIYDFIAKLRKNPRELEVLGDGNQEKNYFMVEDCIDGMLCAFQNSDAQYDVFNLGSESIIKVSRIAEIVIEEMNLSNVKIKYAGGKRGWPGDAPMVHYDLSKMKKLGWEARYSSEEAIRLATKRLLGTSS